MKKLIYLLSFFPFLFWFMKDDISQFMLYSIITILNFVIVFLFLKWRTMEKKEALVEHNNFYFTELFKVTSDVMWETNLHGELTKIEGRFEEILGFPPARFIGLNTSVLIPKRENMKMLEEVPLQNEENTIISYEAKLNSAFGKPVYARITRFPFLDMKGNQIGYRGYAKDITMEIEMLTLLQASEQRFKDLTTMLPQCLLELNNEGKILFINDFGKKMLGFENLSLKHVKIYDILLNKHHLEIEKRLEKALNNEQTYAIPMTVVNTNMEEIPTLIYFDRLKVNNENQGIIVLIVDIRTQKVIEEKLKKSEMQYRNIFNNVQDGIIVIDRQRNIIEINNQSEKMSGYHAKEIAKLKINDLIPNRNFILELEKHPDDSILFISHCKRKNNTYFPAEINVKKSPYDNTYVASIRDISDRINTQETILKLNQAIEQSRLAVLIADANGVAEYVNQSYRELQNQEEDEILEQPVPYLTKLITTESFQKSVSEKGHWNEVQSQIIDDNERWYSISINPVLASQELTHFVVMKEDITLQKQMQDKVNSQNKLIKAVINAIPDIIYFKDNDNLFLGCNKAFEEFVQKKECDILGKNDFQIYEDQNYASIQKLQDQNIINFQTNERVLNTISYLGKRIELDMLKVPNYNAEGEFLGVIAVGRDLTKQKAIETDLKKANYQADQALQEAEKANQAKGQFLANMSHELRTPLNGILGITTLIKGTSISQQQKEYLEIIENSSASLIALINDILDFSKMDTGNMLIEEHQFDFITEMRSIITSFAVEASRKRIELLVDIAPELPKAVQTDSNKLRQILVNLIGNAIKFTESGYVKVIIHQIDNFNDRALINFAICDTGIGIKPENHDTIFETFKQADGSMNRKFGGTGLGLSITKQLVTLLNGELKLESIFGKGTTFEVTLPITIVNEEIYLPHNKSHQEKNILLLESVYESAQTLKHTLAYLNCNVITANTVEKARSYWNKQTGNVRFHTVFVDENFYIEENREILNEIAHSIEIPVIIFHEIHHEEKFRKYDKYEHFLRLVKPIFPHQIAQALTFSSQMNSQTKTTEKECPQKTTNNAGIRVLCADDSLINRKVMEAYAQTNKWNFTAVANGKEAFDLAESEKFDVIFMDIQMPIMDGLTATKLIRNKSKNKETVIIALSGYTSDEDTDEMKEAGITTFLMKPFTNDKLEKILTDLSISSPPKRTNSPKQESQKINQKEFIKQIDWKHLVELSGNDFDFIFLLLDEFKKLYETSFPTLQEEIRVKHFKDIVSIAHKLKGSVANFGANDLSSLFLKLEMAGKSEETNFSYNKIMNQIEENYRHFCTEIEFKKKALNKT